MQGFDNIFIGTDSEGSSMTFKLAQAGRESLLFEIGGFVLSGKENRDAKKVVAEGIYSTEEEWHDNDDKSLPLPMAVKLPQNYTENASLVKLENFKDFFDPTDPKAHEHTNCLNLFFGHMKVIL